MIGTKSRYERSRTHASGGRRGLYLLALAAVSLVAVICLMMASADQAPYGATQVWSEESADAVTWATSSPIGSEVIGNIQYGQDTGTLPVTALVHTGLR